MAIRGALLLTQFSNTVFIPAFAGYVEEGEEESIPAFAGLVQEEEGSIPAFAGYVREDDGSMPAFC